MADQDERTASPLWRMIRMAAFGLLAVMCLGAVFGYIGAYLNDGDPVDLRFFLILAAILLLLAASTGLAVREYRKSPDKEPLTAKERLNRNVLIVSGLLGGIIGLALAIAGGFDEPKLAILSSDPLPPLLAAALVVVIGLVLPALVVFWLRQAIDEQEAAAYKSGALAALYLYMIGAPVWWFAWRGGFAPEPSGVVIYLATVFVFSAVGFWRKYR